MSIGHRLNFCHPWQLSGRFDSNDETVMKAIRAVLIDQYTYLSFTHENKRLLADIKAKGVLSPKLLV